MEFKKYNSIENSYRDKFIEKIMQIVPPDETWCVTEKIHGANFSFITDGNEVKCAKRSGIIVENEKFYNWQIVYEKYVDEVKKVFDYLKYYETEDVNLKYIQLYGEIFGEYYPNQENKYKPIQKGVFYTNDIEFMAFDLRIVYYDYVLEEEINNFIRVENFIKVMKNVNIPTIPVLFEGTLEECLKSSNEFESVIPEKLGLPKIEGNICEGVIIKPNSVYFTPVGERVILKNKNSKFAERKSVKKPKKSNVDMNLNEQENNLANGLETYLNTNRLESLLSKGEVQLDWKQFGKVCGLLLKDMLEDFKKDNDEFEKLDKDRQKVIQNYVMKRVQDFVRDFFKKYI